eukprot:TRINITY_DN11028_c0_g1_i2.p1 TRINITY_DN11028_c0_g1~~TRINITY_DN11028_c0_g1_i2.p1  ORF type:complete len:207 (-),score=62.36 TRINITY_DN11028_c0_g1_i2:11-631(-)
MTLHNALGAAQDYLTQRSQSIEKTQQRLQLEIEAKEVGILRTMLWQRRHLPLRTQLAVLRRPVFANSTFAKRLLEKHTDGQSLVEQLEALLPDALKASASKPAESTDRLAAAGSSGRVHVVSSGLSSMVKSMEKTLETSRDKLRSAMKGSSAADLSPEAKTELTKLVGAIDGTLQQAHATKDLKTRLDALYAMQEQLQRTLAKVMR